MDTIKQDSEFQIYNSLLDEEAAIVNLFQQLHIEIKPQYIFGILQAFDFYITINEKLNIEELNFIKPRYSMLEYLLNSNILDGVEKKEPLTKKNYLLNSITKELEDNYIISEIKYKNELGHYESHFITIIEYSSKESTLSFFKHNSNTIITEDIENASAEMFKALKGKSYYLFPKSNENKKFNFKKSVPNIIEELTSYFYDDKIKDHGLSAMLNFEKRFIEICNNFTEFKTFAKNNTSKNCINDSAKSGYRDFFFRFLNETIKKADDGTGEIKCAHEIYKEVRDRWTIFNELLEKASKSENKLNEHRDELIHRYHFIADESEQLAFHFLKEYNEAKPE